MKSKVPLKKQYQPNELIDIEYRKQQKKLKQHHYSMGYSDGYSDGYAECRRLKPKSYTSSTGINSSNVVALSQVPSVAIGNGNVPPKKYAWADEPGSPVTRRRSRSRDRAR